MILIIDRIEDDNIIAIMKDGTELVLEISDFDILLYEGDIIDIGFRARKINEPSMRNKIRKLQKELTKTQKNIAL